MFNSNIRLGLSVISSAVVSTLTICAPGTVSFFPGAQAKTCEWLFEDLSENKQMLSELSSSVGEQLVDLVEKIDRHYRRTHQTTANGSYRRSIEDLAELGRNGQTEIQFESNGETFAVSGRLTNGFGPHLVVDRIAKDGNRQTIQTIAAASPYNPSFNDVLQVSKTRGTGSRFIGVTTAASENALVFHDLSDLTKSVWLTQKDFAANGVAVIKLSGTEMIVQRRETYAQSQTPPANRMEALKRALANRLGKNEEQILIEYFVFDATSGSVRHVSGIRHSRIATKEDSRSNAIGRP